MPSPSDPAAGGPNAPNPPLTITPFPDGTGQIAVAAGWSAVRLGEGCAVLVRPDGAQITMGAGMHLVDPRGAAYAAYRDAYATTGTIPPGVLVLPYTADPAQAFVAVNQAIAMQAGRPDPQIHVQSSKPLAATPNCTAAYVEATAVVNTVPVRIRGNVFLMAPSPSGDWSSTVNLVCAPDATFDEDEPALLAMFSSYVLDTDARRKQVEHLQASVAAGAATSAPDHAAIFDRSMKDAKAAQSRIDKSTAAFIQGMFPPDG